MVFLISQFLFLLAGLVGLIVWAWSDVPMMWREIAINTRRNPEQGSPYAMVKVLSVCLKILAVVLWIAGIASIVAVAVAGSAFNGWVNGVIER